MRIVEDNGFQEIMGAGRPDIQIPSRTTLSDDIKRAYDVSRDRIAKLLQVWTMFERFVPD